MRSVVIIPARYESSRFPGKPLTRLLGKPMILWVAELSSRAVGRENVYVATDDERIYDTVIDAGFESVMTKRDCLTGTDRLAEASKKISADIYINVQGDEPLVSPDDIVNIINIKKAHYKSIVNGYCPIEPHEDVNNINIPKVVLTENGRLVYMSRSVIPGVKGQKAQAVQYYKQVCIYAFTYDELEEYAGYGRKSVIEDLEDIEILRFLELGREIIMARTTHGTLAVDTSEDVIKVEHALKVKHNV